MIQSGSITVTYGGMTLGTVVSLRWVNPHSILRDFDRWFEFERQAQGL